MELELKLAFQIVMEKNKAWNLLTYSLITSLQNVCRKYKHMYQLLFASYFCVP